MAVTTRVVNGQIIISSTGRPDRSFPIFSTGIKSARVVAGHLTLTLTDNSTVDAGPITVVDIKSISPQGLVTLSDNTNYQLDLPTPRSIVSVSPTGLITFSDGSTQQLTLPGARGITSVSPTGLITYTDGGTQQLTLPVAPVIPTYVAITGGDINVPVSGVTTLGPGPSGTASALFNVQGGDVYITETGTNPTSSSPAYTDGTQLRVTNLAAFKCTAKNGVPSLVGHYERVT